MHPATATVASNPTQASTRGLTMVVRMLASESPGYHIDAADCLCVAQAPAGAGGWQAGPLEVRRRVPV